MEKVILVDAQDREVGVEEKLKAHLSGKLHRAVSVFIFNKQGETLLQQRAFSKYHSGGLWSNTCCGHPRPGETPLKAAERRLQEEMGISASLNKIFDFTYRAELDKGLIEHEFDHVFYGEFEGVFEANPQEVAAWKWMSMQDLEKAIQSESAHFTYWFKLIFPRILAHV
jgi:isopentenyl-diphosphate delta-isomerase